MRARAGRLRLAFGSDFRPLCLYVTFHPAAAAPDQSRLSISAASSSVYPGRGRHELTTSMPPPSAAAAAAVGAAAGATATAPRAPAQARAAGASAGASAAIGCAPSASPSAGASSALRDGFSVRGGGVLHVVPVAELLLLLGLPGDGNPRAELAAVAVDVGVAGA